MSAFADIRRDAPAEERPRIAVGPFGFAIAAQDLQRWLARAKTGATLEYANGLALPRGAASVTLARELAEAKVVHLKQERAGKGWRFLVEKATHPSAAPRARAETPRADPDAEALLRVLTRHANLGLACPSNAELAKLTELNDAEAARYQLRKLAAAGTIKLAHFGPTQPRVVTIVATGKATAEAGS